MLVGLARIASGNGVHNVCAHEWVPGEGENFTLKCHCGFGCDQNQYSLAPL